MTSPQGKKGRDHYSYFTEEETKAQRLVKCFPKFAQQLSIEDRLKLQILCIQKYSLLE